MFSVGLHATTAGCCPTVISCLHIKTDGAAQASLQAVHRCIQPAGLYLQVARQPAMPWKSTCMQSGAFQILALILATSATTNSSMTALAWLLLLLQRLLKLPNGATRCTLRCTGGLDNCCAWLCVCSQQDRLRCGLRTSCIGEGSSASGNAARMMTQHTCQGRGSRFAWLFATRLCQFLIAHILSCKVPRQQQQPVEAGRFLADCTSHGGHAPGSCAQLRH